LTKNSRISCDGDICLHRESEPDEHRWEKTSSPNELNVTTFSVVKTDSKLKIKNV